MDLHPSSNDVVSLCLKTTFLFHCYYLGHNEIVCILLFENETRSGCCSLYLHRYYLYVYYLTAPDAGLLHTRYWVNTGVEVDGRNGMCTGSLSMTTLCQHDFPNPESLNLCDMLCYACVYLYLSKKDSLNQKQYSECKIRNIT